MSEQYQPDQLSLVSREEIYELEDAEQRRDLRNYLAATAQYCIAAAYEITSTLVVDGEEPKSRRKPITLPDQWLESPR